MADKTIINIPIEGKIFKNQHKKHADNTIIVNNKFVIVRTPKTGSTTLCDAFKSHNQVEFINNNLYMHEGIQSLKYLAPKEEYPDVKYIGIARNPYAKFIAWYFHCIWHRHIRETTDFVEFSAINDNIARQHCETKKYHFINGKYAMDIMYCFEDGIKKVLDDISTSFSVKANNKTIHTNKNPIAKRILQASNSYNRLDFLCQHPEAVINIKKNYKKDFEFYGYSMDPEEMMLPPHNHNIEYRRLQ